MEFSVYLYSVNRGEKSKRLDFVKKARATPCVLREFLQEMARVTSCLFGTNLVEPTFY